MLEHARNAIHAALEAWRRAASARHVRHSAPHVTRPGLAAGLARLGVAPGDTLFVHSSLKSLGYVEGGALAVIGALQDAVGPQGTLLLPTYYLPGGTLRATCAMPGYVFDPRRHGTHMGRLPEAFLASGAIHRSIHPTHSVSAWGRHASELTEAHHRAPSIFGMGSPWQRFIGCDHAKVLGLGISMGPVTFYHALEDAMGDTFPVPVWEDDTKLLACLDHAGRRWEVPVRPFEPAVAQRRIDQPGRGDLRDYFHREFDAAGLRVNGQVGDAASWCIPAQAFYAHLHRLAIEHVTIYASAAQLAARPIGRA
ncbi:AAC(3) family N-acetyltransferase [Janthinobacterium lividum]|uniref:AAC(3) family N-acetyltransferase n=1 Tax=Janthinobacterium lividum TaxID=29581 RepID=UPI0008749865|nr:AAC(3) family N-acetyltransferase [Janthinobacterium lividum]MCC7712387.1 AAC(3) family N-acetyltransferase [Janthinobacterium lividum]OEZ62336.1 SPBc2 prophage-derived aminoglycoside N(3')-acetyltransferase-like protein YokD [Janthinobacterium lividum]WQE26942.1 AAC(3) family N-acetyltransferase [Janthinobacterium lividum]STQ97828.1 SPBc2 prophage-derived aminoglycoside N(3 ')-acetyltransferase-like protein yokD [Janthinobacterium lividum]